jgi:hypothetical protein
MIKKGVSAKAVNGKPMTSVSAWRSARNLSRFSPWFCVKVWCWSVAASSSAWSAHSSPSACCDWNYGEFPAFPGPARNPRRSHDRSTLRVIGSFHGFNAHPTPRQKKIRRILLATAALISFAGVTYGVSRLRPAALPWTAPRDTWRTYDILRGHPSWTMGTIGRVSGDDLATDDW